MRGLGFSANLNASRCKLGLGSEMRTNSRTGRRIKLQFQGVGAQPHGLSNVVMVLREEFITVI